MLLALLIVAPLRPAHAYVDPNSVGSLYQFLFPALIAIASAFAALRRQLVRLWNRVVGTVVREHSRHNWTGKWMSEVEGQGASSTVFRVMRWVSEQGRPAIFRPPYVGPHKEFKYCEAAVMPWAGGSGLVDRVLVAVDFLMN